MFIFVSVSGHKPWEMGSCLPFKDMNEHRRRTTTSLKVCHSFYIRTYISFDYSQHLFLMLILLLMELIYY